MGRPTSTRLTWAGLAACRLVAAVLVAVVVTACQADRPGAPASEATDDPGVVHVHGLGVNPRDGVLYAATHTGLFMIRDGGARRVGDRYQDTMGFTVVGPDHFLGSGHPDLRDRRLLKADRPPLLGLVESRDAGATWEPLSLLGETDFHALEVAHGQVHGYDATGGRLMVSRDRISWQVRSAVDLLGFAVSPTDPDLLVAMTPRGLARSSNGGRRWQPIPGPDLLALDWAAPLSLWGIDRQGRVWLSADAGRTWGQRGRLPGPPEALLATGDVLYAAVHEQGILSSSDGARTWRWVYRPPRPAG